MYRLLPWSGARTRHRDASWEVILEPDEETRSVVVVTAYA